MVTLRAPAKINLTLEVLARRDDGYHGIRSVIVPLELADELSFERSTHFSFACTLAELDGEQNLVIAALRAVGELPPLRVELRKRIPVQAGLGGGSSDAAAALRAAMSGELGPTPPRDWLRLARSLGSDVPFFLAGTGALVEGMGERVTPAGAIPRWHVLIVKPPVSVSTATAYAEIDRMERPQRPRRGCVSIAMLEALQRADISAVSSLMQNDFQTIMTSKSDEIAAAMRALRSAGAPNALLAGSGSCVFSVARERDNVETIREHLELPACYETFVTAFASRSQWRR